MNTASRMESNGVKGRIHVSQATADALILAGHSKWLISREGGIEAKGLGLLATYFVALEEAERTNTSRSISLSEFTDREEEDDVAGLVAENKNSPT